MSITITAQDGSDDTASPVRITRYDAPSESGNIITPLIAPGAIAVTLVGDLPPAGTVTLLFNNDTDAQSCRSLLGRETSYTLTDDDRPVLDMTFVRRGSLSPVMHDELDEVWFLEVGFQEIDP